MAYGALGGGTFTVQNKVLPGTYTRMISKAGNTNVWQDRGYATIALPLDWGKENEILTLSREQFEKHSVSLLGHEETDKELRPIREIFQGAKILHLYNLAKGGTAASAKIGELTVSAVHPGVAGDNISVKIEEDISESGLFRIVTSFNDREQDSQSIAKVEDFSPVGLITVSGKLDSSSATVSTKLEGGKNGTVTAAAHNDYLKKIQGEYFNVIGYAGDDETIRRMYEKFVTEQVYDVGYMCQLVVHKSETANDRFITNVYYDAKGDGVKAYESVYWYLGQSAGIDLGKSIAAKTYTGETEVETITDTFEAENAIRSGRLVMIKSDGDVKILEDVNSFTNYSKDLREDWSMNEVVRIVIQRVQNISMLFNKYYMHKELNDEIGRAKLWSDIAWSAKEQFQQQLRIIEDYSEDDTVVTKGEQKGGVVINDAIKPVVTMAKLYLTVAIG